MKRGVTLLLTLAVWVFGSTTAVAQPLEPREDEATHNAEAMKQAQAGNYDAAVEEQKKAVAIRGLNVFWLNLGRFEQRAGRCADSMTSYTNAITAPAVTEPAAKVVRETAQRYITELAEECPPP